MGMYNPPHPGRILWHHWMHPGPLSIGTTARHLGITPGALAGVISGLLPLSVELAVRLEKAGWGRAEVWLDKQMAHDLWQAKQRADSMQVTALPSAAPIIYEDESDAQAAAA